MSYLSLAKKLGDSLPGVARALSRRAAGGSSAAHAAIAAEGARRARQRAVASTLTEDQWRQKNLLQQGWEIGRPTLGDAAINAAFSGIFGASALAQGANPGEALGISAYDWLLQGAIDASAGTIAGGIGARRFRNLPSAQVREKSAGLTNTVKMVGGVGTMFAPNIPYDNAMERLQREAQLAAADPAVQIQDEMNLRNQQTIQSQLPASPSDPQLEYLRALMSGYNQPYDYA